ncbi:MAG TPA: tetratricopeptide repeat-containing glycosyltransferase family protein [Tepidisphaeraceae bacterium]|nr:tetratricopeptide repeat-containing glycosyltransferase family protein [Tepidisphaeraceae bacterium]
MQQAFELAGQHASAGRFPEAEHIYRAILTSFPNDVSTHNNLGTVLCKQNRWAEAVEIYRKAISLQPQYAPAHINLAIALESSGQFDEAIASYRQALSMQPDHVELMHSLGLALSNVDHLDQAIELFRQAIERRPDFGEVWNSLAIALRDNGQINQAIEAHRKAVALLPKRAKFRSHLGMTLLTTGEYREGFALTEARWQSPEEWGTKAWNLPAPRWDGQPLNGRTILIHAEQGFGDVIQFARYIPLIAQRGGKVILACQFELRKLLSGVEGLFYIATPGSAVPRFDFHCPLLSLPFTFGTTLETIPRNVPYLRAAARSSADWAERLKPYREKLKVGLCWSGRSVTQRFRRRNLTINQLVPLADMDNVQLFSLQKGDAGAELKQAGSAINIIDWTNDLADFADTAALIQNMDLVISVDSAPAHLAGALGKPTWVMLGFSADWRWLLNRSDSPWYPTMKLFRQPVQGDWRSVINLVGEELRNLSKK